MVPIDDNVEKKWETEFRDPATDGMPTGIGFRLVAAMATPSPVHINTWLSSCIQSELCREEGPDDLLH